MKGMASKNERISGQNGLSMPFLLMNIEDIH